MFYFITQIARARAHIHIHTHTPLLLKSANLYFVEAQIILALNSHKK